MATEQIDSNIDITVAKDLLNQSLPRLARGVNTIVLIVACLFAITMIISMLRLAADVGFGQGVLSGTITTVFKLLIVVIVIRLVLLPVLQNVIYQSLFERGELREVQLAESRQPLSQGFVSHGKYNYMIHGGMVILEHLFGTFIPTQKQAYKMNPDDRLNQLAFFYADETPVTNNEGKGLALVDSKNPMKQWLLRKRVLPQQQ